MVWVPLGILVLFRGPQGQSYFHKDTETLLLVQSLAAWCFKRPIFQTSEFGVRKGLLTEKMPAPDEGVAIRLPQIHLKRAQYSSLFYVKGRENGWLPTAGIWAPRKISKSLNLFVHGPLTPVGLSLVLRLLKISDKQSLFLSMFPHLYRRATFGQGAVLPKIQASSRNPL